MPWPLATPVSAGQLDVGETYRGLLQPALKLCDVFACFHSRGARHGPPHGLVARSFALWRCGFGHGVDSRGLGLNFIEIHALVALKLNR